jgi:hypothetical protein
MSHAPRALSLIAALLGLALSLVPVRVARAAAGETGPCASPRTSVLLAPLGDRTDGRWALVSAVRPAEVVAARLAQVLGDDRRVVRTRGLGSKTMRTGVADAELLEAARREQAEVAVTGVVETFTNEDVSTPGKFARWGDIGGRDGSTEARVEVSLRVLDVRDGTVLIESRSSRTRRFRGFASASRRDEAPLLGEALAQALDEVVRDLDRVLAQRLDARWESRVVSDLAGGGWLDAGVARGVFVGQRFEVWRSGTEIIDEDHIRIGDEDRRVAAIEVESLQGRGRARIRVVEGAIRSGDVVRPCRGGDEVAVAR